MEDQNFREMLKRLDKIAREYYSVEFRCLEYDRRIYVMQMYLEELAVGFYQWLG